MRLIRSKGVGVYFVSQNPLDILDVVLGQLGNRVQHALRAFTPRDQKAVKAAAETFRQNPKLKVETVLTQLAVGEALVSMLDENGSPQIVERAKIVPPRSQVGTISADQRKEIIASSIISGHYEKAIDRESAYEILQARAGEKTQTAGAPPVAAKLWHRHPCRWGDGLGSPCHKKSPDPFCAPGDLNGCSFMASAHRPGWWAVSSFPCLPSLPLLWPTLRK